MDIDKKLILYASIGHVRASWLTLTIAFSKADQSGRGRIGTHHIIPDNPLHCIVQRMEAYIMLSRDYFSATEYSILFDIPGFPLLSSESVTILMRRTCELLGFPSFRVMTLSCRTRR